MVIVDVTVSSYRGVWIDGYLPGIKKMKELAHEYRHLDIDRHGLPREYGFTEAGESWEQEDFFAAIASALRTRFDHDKLPPDVRPTPCLTWLVQVRNESPDPRLSALHREYRADARREDYHHLITVGEECPISKDCLGHVLTKLDFEPKPDKAYMDKKRFSNTVHEVLTHYVSIVAAPWLEVERQLEANFDKMVSVGP